MPRGPTPKPGVRFVDEDGNYIANPYAEPSIYLTYTPSTSRSILAGTDPQNTASPTSADAKWIFTASPISVGGKIFTASPLSADAKNTASPISADARILWKAETETQSQIRSDASQATQIKTTGAQSSKNINRAVTASSN
ncbi:hypothetical protein EJ08DRAFT_665976 [Tothia fuscella]|uniref:Uncharacterized protein n=1 Tax=Tothia fuscella TaxID=1048955 RepID=A0A9P4TTC2_9PEZI|nr:hypothetical protein EJ08DRAFT_665976 [Tothia fuscella]